MDIIIPQTFELANFPHSNIHGFYAEIFSVRFLLRNGVREDSKADNKINIHIPL